MLAGLTLLRVVSALSCLDGACVARTDADLPGVAFVAPIFWGCALRGAGWFCCGVGVAAVAVPAGAAMSASMSRAMMQRGRQDKKRVGMARGVAGGRGGRMRPVLAHASQRRKPDVQHEPRWGKVRQGHARWRASGGQGAAHCKARRVLCLCWRVKNVAMWLHRETMQQWPGTFPVLQ